jgi:hypothetical protein
MLAGASAGALLCAAGSLFSCRAADGRSPAREAAPVLIVNSALIACLVGYYTFVLPPALLGARFHLPRVKWKDPWADVGYWCEANTPKDAVFIVPPQSNCFRTLSKRAIVASWKDGAKVMFSEKFAYQWAARLRDLAETENLTEEQCMKLAAKYGASHVVVLSEHKLHFPKLYQNDQYSVYEIRGG